MKATTVSFAAALGLLAGCLDASDPTLNTTESHVETQNRLAANRLAANRLAANRLAANRLAANRLAANGLPLASTEAEDMAADEAGLDLLTYMVSCALPEGQSLVVGTTELPGSIGLAPDWLSQGLSTSERRWVSACLLARVNYFGVTVHLSMRGDSDALATTADERTAFPRFEGAFWGDLFASDGSPQEMKSCISTLKASAPQDGTMPLRECTVVDAATGLTRCGYESAGTCENVCSGAQCAGESEVIQVFLETP